MKAYACYRLPKAKTFVRVEGSPMEIQSYSQIGCQSGFVVAPFAIAPHTPLLIIKPESIETHAVGEGEEPAISNAAGTLSSSNHADRMRYASNFKTFHDKLADGTFRKIVLARTAEESVNAAPETLFLTACRLYPNLFVALVCTPQCGTWITATPEILIECHNHHYHTMALAGTMTKGHHWNTKNIEEQGYVADYISDSISTFAHDISISGPHTVSAGDIVHLRTDFTFALNDGHTIGDVVGHLHPTPAVCGMPKQQTMAFIQDNECHPRLYYSGFMGPVDLCGHTNLYVSLRCMHITGDQCRLYAGGGLLNESVEEEEWGETEAKMLTMRRCLMATSIRHSDDQCE